MVENGRLERDIIGELRSTLDIAEQRAGEMKTAQLENTIMHIKYRGFLFRYEITINSHIIVCHLNKLISQMAKIIILDLRFDI